MRLPALLTRTVGAVRALVPTNQKAAVSALGLRDVFGFVKESFAGAWQKNVVVDSRESVVAYAPVWACLTRIANDIATLRIMLIEAREDGTEPEAVSTSPYWPVLRKPNHYQNRIQFLTEWVLMKLLHGNTYALKRRDARGIVVELYVLDSRRVTPLVTPDGSIYYQLAADQLAGLPSGATVPASEIIHDRGPTLWHPLVGISPLYAAARSSTQANRIQANSSVFFENMSRPSGMLTAPGTIDETTAKRLKTEWEANFSGSNLGRLAVLGNGLSYEAMTIPAQTAQLIEQLRWTAEDVARAFGMPLYKIGAGPVPTSGNVQALQQQYYNECLRTNIEAIELCLDEGLGLTTTGYTTQLDLDGLLRMDGVALIDYLSKAVEGGLMAPNEGRKRLKLKPLKGGDTVYMQQQNYSMEALAKRDAKEDPFGTPAPASPASATVSQPEAPEPPNPDQGAKDLADLLAKSMEAIQAAAERAALADQARATAEAEAFAAKQAAEAVRAAAADTERNAMEVAEADAVAFMAQISKALDAEPA